MAILSCWLWSLGACAEPAQEVDPDKSDSVVDSQWLWPAGDVYVMVDTNFWEFNVAWALDNAAEELAENTGIRVHFIEEVGESPEGYYTNFHGRFGWNKGGSAPVGIRKAGEASAGGKSVRHELSHIIGLNHTQARVDRDEHVTVHWKYIRAGKRHNFNVRDGHIIGPYDTRSIMHYSSTSFTTTDSCATISLQLPGDAPNQDVCVSDKSRQIHRTNRWSDWNYSTLAVLYCDERFCGDRCASTSRCHAPAVQNHLARFYNWEQSDEGRALAERWPQHVPR